MVPTISAIPRTPTATAPRIVAVELPGVTPRLSRSDGAVTFTGLEVGKAVTIKRGVVVAAIDGVTVREGYGVISKRGVDVSDGIGETEDVIVYDDVSVYDEVPEGVIVPDEVVV